MIKTFLGASALALMLATPAFADVNKPVQDPTSGKDPVRTSSAPLQDSPTKPGIDRPTSAETNTVPAHGNAASNTPPVQDMVSGKDPSRTGSAALPHDKGDGTGFAAGSAAGTEKGNQARLGAAPTQPVQARPDGSDPIRTGSAALPAGKAAVTGSALGSGHDQSATSDPGRARELVGRDVRGMNGEDLGQVDDVAFVDGRTVLVISVDGFMGGQNRLVTIPWDQATMSSDSVKLNLTKDELSARPAYHPMPHDAAKSSGTTGSGMTGGMKK